MGINCLLKAGILLALVWVGAQAQVKSKKTETIYIDSSGLNVRSQANLNQVLTSTGGDSFFKVQIPARHIVRTSQGAIDFEKTFATWASDDEANIPTRGTTLFFPVTVMELDLEGSVPRWRESALGENQPMAAMLFAARREMLVEVSSHELDSILESQIQSRFLSMSPRDYRRWVDYSKARWPVSPECRPNDRDSFFSFADQLSSLQETRFRCLPVPHPTGTTKLFPDEGFDVPRSQCMGWVRDVACSNDKMRGLSVAERAERVMELAAPFAQELNLNPAVFPCLGGRETTTLKTNIRTLTACPSRPNGFTAAGMFQVTRTTLGDLVNRGFLDLRDGADGESAQLADQPQVRELLEKVLGPELSRSLKEPGISLVRSRGPSCNDQCQRVRDALYDQMANSMELQIVLAGIIFSRDKNYRFENYYGNSDPAENRRYAQAIENCLKCMHRGFTVGQADVGSCVARASNSDPQAVERENRSFEERCQGQGGAECDI